MRSARPSVTRAEDDPLPQFYPWFTSFQDAAFGPTGIADSLYLSLLAVEPSSQRKGLGRALVEAALEEADRLGVPSTLVTQEADKVGRFNFDQGRWLLEAERWSSF